MILIARPKLQGLLSRSGLARMCPGSEAEAMAWPLSSGGSDSLTFPFKEMNQKDPGRT